MKNLSIMERQHKLQALIKEHKMGAVVLNPGPDLSYITGLNFHLMERPVVGIFPGEGTPVLILPELERAKVAQLDYKLATYFYNEDQSTWTSVFRTALTEAGLEKARSYPAICAYWNYPTLKAPARSWKSCPGKKFSNR